MLGALTITLLAYLMLAAAFYGLGFACIRVLGASTSERPEPLWLVWQGWALYLLFLLSVHLFLPLQAAVVSPPLLLGLVVFLRAQPWRGLRLSWRHGVTCGLALPVATWVAARSMLVPTNYDTGLYHLQSIRWDNTFPLVPGLGNLHDRLAFNQSFFEFAAALNFHPYFGHGAALANSFLYLLTLASLMALVSWRNFLQGCPLEKLSPLLPIAYLAYLGTHFSSLNSASPDLTGELLQILMLVSLTRQISRISRGQTSPALQDALLATLAAVAITVKLSNLVFSGLTLLVLVNNYRWQLLRHKRIFLMALALLVVWSIRGYVLSGMPLFPLSLD